MLFNEFVLIIDLNSVNLRQGEPRRLNVSVTLINDLNLVLHIIITSFYIAHKLIDLVVFLTYV